MEVDMPSSTFIRMFIGALLCTTCTMNFAMAQGHGSSAVSVLSPASSPQTDFWSRLFSCKSKNDPWFVAGASETALVKSNLLTEEGAEAFAKKYWGESAAAPHVYSIGKWVPFKKEHRRSSFVISQTEATNSPDRLR
jgi:hypothetical protein